MDKGACADAQRMREVVAAKAKLQGGRFSVFRRQKLSCGQWPRALVEQTFPDHEGICRQNSGRSVLQRCTKALSIGRAITRWPGAVTQVCLKLLLQSALDRNPEVSELCRKLKIV